ncbi:MAG TPA: DUF4954 family protein, partial [Ferruginibacter sp.]|nr:DUF4954 family protein [Ferruginibacter sp.]
SRISRSEWMNVGGQLIRTERIAFLKKQVKAGKFKNWDDIHQFYVSEGKTYAADKLLHAYTSLLEILQITGKQFSPEIFSGLLKEAVDTTEWMVQGIYQSREKDYSNAFRKMAYDNNEEMQKVLGRFEDNSFIKDQLAALDQLKKETRSLQRKWKL